MSQPQGEGAKGYGNIYTPHAGSMIINVQRESGLANRTMVLSPRQVRLLRLATSRYGLALALAVVGSWAYFAFEAARVPVLQNRIESMEDDAARLDTLQHTVVELQKRYEQVQRMLGASPTPATPAPATTTAAAPVTAPARGAVPAAPAARPADSTDTPAESGN